jgi:high-affinity iron transporter
LAVLCGLSAGALVGFLIYRSGKTFSLQIFLVISTCFLYLVAAGLFSKGVWYLEQNAWVKLAGEGTAEAGAGPGSYDIRKSVWHVNCCTPDGDGGWGIFNSLFGWQNSATYGSVISYNLYWLAVIVGFVVLGLKEKRRLGNDVRSESSNSVVEGGKKDEVDATRSVVREVEG